MFTKRNILFICLLPLVFWASAQPLHIKFTTLTSRDGLLSNSVNAILKDKYGLMWFATDDGLNKFDGTNFTVYRHKPGDSSTLRANEILALHEDRSGKLWIGTSGGAISLYDRERDRFINYPVAGNIDGLTPNSVIRSICSDYMGMLWIAEFGSPYILDPATNHMSRVDITPKAQSPLSATTLNCVFEDSHRRMWVGTDHGLFQYMRATHSFRQFRHDARNRFSLVNDQVKALSEDKEGNLWAGTDEGLCMMRTDESGFVGYRQMGYADTILGSHQINAITTDNDGMLWIGTMVGLHVLDPKTGHSVSYLPEHGNMHSLNTPSVRSIYIDKGGIYWFGTYQGGINKYDKNLNLFNLKLNDAFQENKTSGSGVNSFAEGSDGNVFVGTDGAGLFVFNRKLDHLKQINLMPAGVIAAPLSILALKMTRKNELYIGTYANGLFILDPVTGKKKHLTMGPDFSQLNAKDVFCIKEDSKGEIWLGTNGSGINVLRDSKVIAKYNPRPKGSGEIELPVNGYIRAIEEDSNGNMWIGSHGGGLAVYNPKTGRFRVYDQDNSKLPSNKIQALLLDSKGRMWVGTYGGGLSVFDKGSNDFVNFSEKDGLQNTTIYQVLEDAQGRIWVSSNTGISSMDIQTRTFQNYNYNNGLQKTNFAHASGIRLSDGVLFFGGLEGFNYFNPADITTNRNRPPVIITDLKVANKSIVPEDGSLISEPISIAKEIRLAFKQNFALSFVALNYTMPKQNHYAYKLDGFDRDWNYTGSINTAYYTNLDPGTYTFRVKASNNDGVWSSEDTSIKIFVKPPLWRTGYAYLFYILAATGLLLYIRHRGITRLRKKFELEQERREARRVRELDQMKLKFITNLSHEFRTPISLIMGPVDQLLSKHHPSQEQDKLQMIRRNARRLLNLVNQLLDFRKMEEHELELQPTEGDFIAFVKDISNSFTDLSERKNIRFVVKSNTDRLIVYFDRDKIERILFNLLSNAFKFTLGGGEITLFLESQEEEKETARKWVSIKIQDTGIGILPDKRERIFERFFQDSSTSAILNQGSGLGLSITREFVKMHGGTINVESESGKGSIFTVRLPLIAAQTSMPLPEPQTVFANTGIAGGPGQETSGEEAGIPAEKPSILLVEDNDDFRVYLRDSLRSHYKVFEAVDGNEGWQKALSAHPQLIVSDISMPQMDGIALVRKLKADKRTSHIPVILLTALMGHEPQMEGLATGANDYITKPFSFDILNAKIKSMLELKNTLKTTYTRQIKVLAPEIPIELEGEKLLSRVIDYLEKNITNSQLSVELLSRHVGMSRSSLYSKLLELTGQTPVEYIRTFKLEKAAVFLEKSDQTITEIATRTGFSNSTYFARAFKTKFNLLPSEYAARARKFKHGNGQQG